MTPRPLRLVLGDNLRRLMERDGLSKSETAARLGMHRTQFYRLLNGETRPHASELKTICDVFGVPASVYFEPLEEPANLTPFCVTLHFEADTAAGDGSTCFCGINAPDEDSAYEIARERLLNDKRRKVYKVHGGDVCAEH